MLTRITVINSHNYGKAQIKLDDCNSLQLVGPNNIGKSTLIYTLNFLFIIDGHKMTFSGHRKGDKDTIHHYLPSPTQSFIIFEIKKNGYYCILLKRDVDGELEYYKINNAYDDTFFFETENGKSIFLPFDKVKEKLITSGINISTYKNKSEIFADVYQRGKRNNGVVWLEDTVKTDGLSNNFSKVYRYLINSKLIDNRALKDALIIADNRENDAMNFSQKNKKDITDLLRINDEIKNVKSIQKDFSNFRDIVNQYRTSTTLLAQSIYVFNQQYLPTIADLAIRSNQKQSEIDKTRIDVNEKLKPKRDTLNQQLGKLAGDIENKRTLQSKKQNELYKIKGFESLEFIKHAIDNLNKERKQIELKLTSIENRGLKRIVIENKIKSLKEDVEKLSLQIKNYSSLLIHEISKDSQSSKLINTILSGQLRNLSSERIKKTISNTSGNLRLYDGEIDIGNLKLEEIESVDDLEKKLGDLNFQLIEYEELLPVVINYEEYQGKLREIEDKIKSYENKLSMIESIPNLEIEIQSITNDIKSCLDEKEQKEKDLNILNEEIQRKEESLTVLAESKREIDNRGNELRNQKTEIDQIVIEPIPLESNDGLTIIYKKIKIYDKNRMDLKERKDRQFDILKNKLSSTIAEEEAFIQFIEDEIACLNDKENSIDGLLKSISTHFSNPAHTLLARYEDFKQFVTNKINSKLQKTRISDIESLKIIINDSKKMIGDLKKISEIQDFSGQLFADLGQQTNLSLLNTYLDTGKRIAFEDLFEIELLLTVKGKDKRVDLAKQVESDGTDRMIRLIIIMSIINRMVISCNENKIAIFIDEIATIDEQNRPELVKFCNDHFFIPIFAAPSSYPEFNKYYFITSSKGKINISEQNAAWNEPN